MFVEANRDQLDGMDFDESNVVSRSLSRELYDWVLHHLGVRELEIYESIIVERRPDGPHRVFDYETYVERGGMRYENIPEVVRVDGVGLNELYDEFDEEITASDLREHDAVAGDVRYLLEYFRVGEFDCEAITVDGEMGVRKRE